MTDDASVKPSPPSAPASRKMWTRVMVALLGGVFFRAGVANWDFWWVGFVEWVPWLWAIDGLRPRRAFAVGYLSGILAIFMGYFWMTSLMTTFAGLPLPAAIGVHLLFSAWQGVQMAAAAACLNAVRARANLRLWWLLPPIWGFFELLIPSIFPTFMSLAWAYHPRLIQIAEVGGAASVSMLMCAMSAALYEAWMDLRAGQRRPAARAAAVFGALVVLTPTLGAWRMRQIQDQQDTAPHLKIGVVQGNFGIKTYSTGRLKQRLLKELQRMTATLEEQGAAVALWGETAYPYSAFARDATKDKPERDRRRIRRGFTIPVIVGMITRDRTRENPYPWNSAWLLQDDGNLGDRYDKVFPLMFGESVPLVDPEWYLEKIPSASYMNIGTGPAVIEHDGYRLAPLICYEDILPAYAQEVSKLGVHAFVNLTNDSWFGKSAEQPEHLGLAIFRTVEHRKALLRSVNAGISVYVSPSGEVINRTEVTDSDNDGYTGADGFVADVPMMDPEHRTIFGVLGVGGFAGVCLAWILACLAWPHRRGRRRQSAGLDATVS